MFLPTTLKEVRARGWDQLDVILFTGDAYIDHPSFGAAVVPEMDGKRLWVVKNRKATSVPVQTDSRDSQFVEVTSGIQVGDTVLTGGLMQLREGMIVNVKLNK